MKYTLVFTPDHPTQLLTEEAEDLRITASDGRSAVIYRPTRMQPRFFVLSAAGGYIEAEISRRCENGSGDAIILMDFTMNELFDLSDVLKDVRKYMQLCLEGSFEYETCDPMEGEHA